MYCKKTFSYVIILLKTANKLITDFEQQQLTEEKNQLKIQELE